MSVGLSEFAVSGEQGLDVFWRVEEANQRRYRYECIANVSADGATIRAYHPHAERHEDKMRAAVERLQDAACLDQPIRLGDASSFPDAQQAGPGLTLFQYLDFLRMWQIAERELHRVSGLAETGAEISGPEISAALRLALDFNRMRRAAPLVRSFMPLLMDVVRNGEDDRWQNAGFALRMVGDIHMRSDDPTAALAAYEASLALGDNAFRRGLAIRAAHAAQDRSATLQHIAQYRSRWELPAPLTEIEKSLAEAKTGEMT